MSYDNPESEDLQNDFETINNLIKDGYKLDVISGGTKLVYITLKKKTCKDLLKEIQ